VRCALDKDDGEQVDPGQMSKRSAPNRPVTELPGCRFRATRRQAVPTGRR
jgi:hypothetical protein